MKHKNIILFGLLLTAMQASFAVNYATIGRRTFKTVVGIPLVTAVMTYEQSPAATKINLARHEASHAVVKTILDNGGHNIEEARINKIFGFINNGYVQLKKDGNEENYQHNMLKAENLIKTCLASISGTAQDKKLRRQQDFVEQELNLPLSRLTDKSHEIPSWGFGPQFNSDLMVSARCAYMINGEIQQIAKTLTQSYQETAKISQQYQPEILLVAQALHDKGSLSGDEIEQLVYQEKK